MDEQLAEIYGTNQSDDDIEKIAAADMLLKLAAENDVDLSQLSDSDVAEMLEEIQKTAAGSESSESSDSPESKEAEAEEKVAEADYLGRVMAHSMNQELREIQKEAKQNWLLSDTTIAKAKHHVGGALSKIKDIATGRQARGAHADVKRLQKLNPHALETSRSKPAGSTAMERFKSMTREGRARMSPEEKLHAFREGAPDLGEGISSIAKNPREKIKADLSKAKGSRLRGAAKTLALYGAGGAGTAAAIHSKTSSINPEVLDDIISERAYELAKEAGWVDQDGDLLVPDASVEQVKEAALEADLDTMALAALEDAGYPVQWNR
jgi:hypothetical protein